MPYLEVLHLVNCFYGSHLMLAVTGFLRDSVSDIGAELILFMSVGTQVP
jgi:hypothetical protein